jgi:hypothetical protein
MNLHIGTKWNSVLSSNAFVHRRLECESVILSINGAEMFHKFYTLTTYVELKLIECCHKDTPCENRRLHIVSRHFNQVRAAIKNLPRLLEYHSTVALHTHVSSGG